MPRLSENIKQKNIVIPYFKDLDVPNLKENYYTLYNAFIRHPWNGGRTKKKSFDYKNLTKYDNVRYSQTFSNFYIDFEDTPYEFLDFFNDNAYELIIVNKDLYNFIRKNYPNIKLTFSITGHISIFEFLKDSNNFSIDGNLLYKKLFEYYDNLFELYDMVVIHTELVLDTIFYAYLVKNNYIHKTEIVINIINGCNFCTKHMEHYKKISKELRKDVISNSAMNCLLENITPNELTKYYYSLNDKHKILSLYDNIKFEGRDDNSYKLFYKSKIKGIHEDLVGKL